MINKIILTALALTFSGYSLAIPTLQLDIVGGTYIGGDEESTITNDTSFTLNAFAMTGYDTSFDYFMSASVISNHDGISAGTDFGSFTIGGNTFSLATGTVYGTPPDGAFNPDLDGVSDPNLPKHGIYPTIFTEVAIDFSLGSLVQAYNVQDDNIQAGEQMHQVNLLIDTSAMLDGFDLHFDLYGYDLSGKKVDVFAPFSHDAGTDNIVKIPEPSIITLLGLGLAGIGFSLRRKKSLKA